MAIIKAHIAAGTKPTDTEKARYRHPDIKASLLIETSEKCAYCESKLRHVTYGDVEHIVPKSVDASKAFEWENLTLACDVCNTNKSNHFGNHDDLVDPYAVNPDDHLQFWGANLLPIPESGPGLATESTLQLNRIELLERRAERLRFLNRQLYLLVEVDGPQKKAVIRRDLEVHELDAKKEYAGMARAYIRSELARIGN